MNDVLICKERLHEPIMHLRALESLNLEARCKSLAPKKIRAETKPKAKPASKKGAAKPKAKPVEEEPEEEEAEEQEAEEEEAETPKPKAPATRKSTKTRA